MTANTERRQHTYKERLALIRPILPKWICACVLSFAIASAYALASPLLTKVLIDQGIIHHNTKLFLVMVVVIAISSVCIRLLMAWLSVFQTSLANRCVTAISERLLVRFFSTQYGASVADQATYLTTRMFDEVFAAAQFICGPLMAWIVSVLTLVVSFGAALWLSWRTTIVLTIVVPPLCVLARRSRPHIELASDLLLEAEAKYKNDLAQSLRAHQAVLRYMLSSRIRRRLGQDLATALNLLRRQTVIVKRSEALSSVSMSIAELLVMVACALSVLAGRLTIGGLIAYLAVFWRAIEHGTTVGQSYSSLIVSSRQMDRLMEMEDFSPIEQRIFSAPSKSCSCVYLCNVRVALDDELSIRYSSFAVGLSERVILYGANGAGKSTLMHALAGSAKILSAEEFQVCDSISGFIVPFHFTPGSLLDHINLEDLPGDRKDMFWAMISEAGLKERVNDENLETWSAGERQKAQIVIALTKLSALYILDEPFSNLDDDARVWATRWITKATLGSASLIITHNHHEATAFADRVIDISSVATKERVSDV